MYPLSYLDDCRKLKDHTVTVLRENLFRLKELMLFRCGEVDFRGDDLWQIKNLETLILRNYVNNLG